MEKIHKIILGVLSGILIVGIIATGIVAATRGNKKFTPPPFDKAAVSGVPEVEDESLGYATLALREGFIMHACSNPIVENGEAVVYFTADENNTVWVRLILMTEDGEQLGSTGLLRAGEYVRSITLSREISEDMPIVMKFLSYEPETYYSQGSVDVNVTLHLRQRVDR